MYTDSKGFHHLFSHAYPLGAAPPVGTGDKVYIQRTGEGVRNFHGLGPACGSTGSHILLMTSAPSLPLPLGEGALSWVEVNAITSIVFLALAIAG